MEENFRTIFRCCTILTDIIITNEKTLVFSRIFLQKKTADIYILGNFVRKRPQTYIAQAISFEITRIKEGNFSLVCYVPSRTNLH
jgi:hypothetical protein